MTDEQIIKNLECCMESECDNCQYQYDTACKEYIFHDCLSLIHNLMNKNKALQHYYDECLKDLKNANAEVERLNKAIDNYETCLEKIETIKAEAVKDFANLAIKKIYENVTPIPQQRYLVKMCIEEIENTKKEMVGEMDV